MTPVTWPRDHKLAEKLLLIDPAADRFGDAIVGDLRNLPRRGDLFVVNDAGTLPASLMGTTRDGAPIEARLVAPEGDAWRCLVLGAGDWRTTTELRPDAPTLAAGDALRFADDLTATVIDVSSRRLVSLRFAQTGDPFWQALYRVGRPVQYAYTRAPLSLLHVQTAYSTRPWAAEMPSAGRPLSWSLLLSLRHQGIGVARLTHAAGISSTGDAGLDATLPWPERFDIPADTAEAVRATRAGGGRVIAVGTSVVRALEGGAAQNQGDLRAGEGVTNLVIGPGFKPAIVGGLFTGLHEATASHFALLQAFASRALIERAYAHAERDGYRGHEFGDSCLILNGVV
jgi:S-adenosylmethionine:tRNA ribosyltransferase-isomerase